MCVPLLQKTVRPAAAVVTWRRTAAPCAVSVGGVVVLVVRVIERRERHMPL
jgi:hypothetical protein